MFIPSRFSAAAILLLTITFVSGQCSGVVGQGLQSPDFVPMNNDVPQQVENVTVEQKLGDKIPTNLPLTDSNGRRVKTGYFIKGDMPTIITLNYSSCPMLCSLQLNQLTKSLRDLDLKIGEDFRILTVSIDPKETTATAAKTKQSYVEQLVREHPRVEEGWTF